MSKKVGILLLIILLILIAILSGGGFFLYKHLEKQKAEKIIQAEEKLVKSFNQEISTKDFTYQVSYNETVYVITMGLKLKTTKFDLKKTYEEDLAEVNDSIMTLVNDRTPFELQTIRGKEILKKDIELELSKNIFNNEVKIEFKRLIVKPFK